jgi:lysine 2,3-aminomutase
MSNWNKDMQKSLRTSAELLQEGLAAAAQCEAIDSAGKIFPLRVPPAYIKSIKSLDESDPVWRTVVPTSAEALITPEELVDPIGDQAHSPVPFITHRHPDRVLLMLTLTCAVYCRFCFRRYAVGQQDHMPSRSEILRAFDYIEKHSEIWEVILTGGDPLIVSDARLEEALGRLRGMEHVEIIRIHTRVPVVMPNRVTPELVRLLRGSGRPRQPVWIVLHVNHPQELTDEVESAVDLLVDNGIPLLNQAVLLRGINDSKEVFEALNRKLVRLRVKPYYLHHADLARGTSHFRTSLEEGIELIRYMRGRVSGLCQPTYVLDIPGGYGKVPVDSSFVQRRDDGKWSVEDVDGRLHVYPPSPGRE